MNRYKRQVSSSKGKYEIKCLSLSELWNELPSESFWFIDQNVYQHWASIIPPSANYKVLGQSEESKNFNAYQKCLEWLFDQKASRSASIVALGGGATLDLAGFVAATYKRGISYHSIPTTLLAQVDASVGGKVGINFGRAKNQVGAFWTPEKILLVPDFLSTLSDREFRSGVAEILKHALVQDPRLLETLKQKPFQRNSSCLLDHILRSIEIKIKIVEADEFEKNGLRSILNYGHTIGHALEMLCYPDLLHGEAVSIGMYQETILAYHLGFCSWFVVEEVKESLRVQGLPFAMPKNIDLEEMIEFFDHDKKREGKELTFSLLVEPGKCKLYKNISKEEVLQIFSKDHHLRHSQS